MRFGRPGWLCGWMAASTVPRACPPSFFDRGIAPANTTEWGTTVFEDGQGLRCVGGNSETSLERAPGKASEIDQDHRNRTHTPLPPIPPPLVPHNLAQVVLVTPPFPPPQPPSLTSKGVEEGRVRSRAARLFRAVPRPARLKIGR